MLEQQEITSKFLARKVTVDFYLPKNIEHPQQLSLLLINDGQNLEQMGFLEIIEEMQSAGEIEPLLCVGIYANEQRKLEYGTARILDYEGRGSKAAAFNSFVLEELLPFISNTYNISSFRQKGYAGFSLGGLTALDMVWHYPELFSVAGVFSGSLWWRTKALHEDYVEERDRIMHAQIRSGTYRPSLRFFFTTGSLDETADRNNNGIIDSIDDTLGLIAELEKQGYRQKEDIEYINFDDGRHDVPTWGRGMPLFLKWAWGRKGNF